MCSLASGKTSFHWVGKQKWAYELGWLSQILFALSVSFGPSFKTPRPRIRLRDNFSIVSYDSWTFWFEQTINTLSSPRRLASLACVKWHTASFHINCVNVELHRKNSWLWSQSGPRENFWSPHAAVWVGCCFTTCWNLAVQSGNREYSWNGH